MENNKIISANSQKTVIKRDGSITLFDKNRIINAIQKSMHDAKNINTEVSKTIADNIYNSHFDGISVEDIERQVVKQLYMMGFDKSADAYSEYKTTRKIMRNQSKRLYNGMFLSSEFISKYKHLSHPFPTELGKFIYYRTYSRPIPEENRREDWWETCFRVVEFNMSLQLDAMKKNGIQISSNELLSLKNEAEEMYDLIYHLKLFPSGRTLWVAGSKPSRINPISNFNCSFVTIDSLKKFSEIFFVLMLGTGVGISVQNEYVSKLPKINSDIEIIHKSYDAVPKNKRKEFTELKQVGETAIEIEIGDSKFGWAKAIEIFFEILSSKQYMDVKYIFLNYNNVRPEGERLKTFGGYASGHNNIKIMFEKISRLFKQKRAIDNMQWQPIKSIDCLDISTIIAENVVSGGVRRSAEIIFCDSDDEEVLNAKSNLFYQDDNGNWVENKRILNRALSNNTVIYKEKPSKNVLDAHFEKIRMSGEPAFANFQEMSRRKSDVQGGNPCFEILLSDRGVCNLTENNLMAYVNKDGTFDKKSMLKAQKLSARIAYRMASIELELHEWDIVNKKDMLTGCSITGVMDFRNATGISDEEFVNLLEILRKTAVDASHELADHIGMNRSQLVTAIKPSGTISQLPTVSSGIHYSHAPYYIRRVRVSAKDPLAIAMMDMGFDWEPEVGQSRENHITKVFSFPIKSPEGKTKYDVSAIEQLELYKLVMEHYVDHNASNTIHVRQDEWDDVCQWVYDNWDCVVGVTFISLDDSFYKLMPYETITKEQYEDLIDKQPIFDTSRLSKYETFEDFDIIDSDCEGGACPIR